MDKGVTKVMMKMKNKSGVVLGQMSLEYIIKMIILLVVVMVVIGMIINFRSDIERYLKEFIGGEKETPPEAEIIRHEKFTSQEVANYILSCYSENMHKQEDVNCYVLIGHMDVSETGIRSALSSSMINPDSVIFPESFDTDAIVIAYNSLYDTVAIR